MKFTLCSGTQPSNIDLPFTEISQLEKFINEAINEKLERATFNTLGNTILVVPKEIKIQAEDDEFLKFNISGEMNIFCQK